MKVTENEDGLIITSEGFSYGDFNKAHKVDLWKLSKHFESSRAATLNLTLRKDFQLDSSSTFFLIYQTSEFSQEFHDIADMFFPWYMKIKVCYVGKTSFWNDLATYCQKTGKLLAQNFSQGVKVCVDSRRSVELPIGSADKYRATMLTKPPQRCSFPSIPPVKERSFTCTTRALPSDTDSNGHVNQSACYKYCYDAASLAALQGNVFTKFCQDFAYYDVKRISVEYVGEINTGDDVEVLCWEDDSNQCTLCFILSVRNKVVCRCVGEWFAGPDGMPISRKGRLNIHLSANM
nr:uncharacterized protein LOC129257750 [Lytechinus pictus]